jgi:hypothetical protein
MVSIPQPRLCFPFRLWFLIRLWLGVRVPVVAGPRRCAASGASPLEDGTVSVGNSHGGPGLGAVVAAARPVVLIRYCPGAVGETASTMHMWSSVDSLSMKLCATSGG